MRITEYILVFVAVFQFRIYFTLSSFWFLPLHMLFFLGVFVCLFLFFFWGVGVGRGVECLDDRGLFTEEQQIISSEVSLSVLWIILN